MFGLVLKASAWDASNPESVKEYIHYLASKEKVNISMALTIARCESGIKAHAIGDGGNSYGVFQIHLPSHPYISKEQALNPFFNISWSIDQMAKGKWNMWSCYKKHYT